MAMPLQTDPVPLREEGDGALRVGNSRVLLELVIHAFDNGATPESIVESYSTLSLSDVYAVISYYLNHRDDVRRYLQKRDEAAAAIRAQIEAQQPPLSNEFRRRIREAQAQQAGR